MNYIYGPEPAQGPPEPNYTDLLHDQVEQELHYLSRCTPTATYAQKLAEALAFTDLERLALAMRDAGNPRAVRDELARIFDAYWESRVIELAQEHIEQ